MCDCRTQRRRRLTVIYYALLLTQVVAQTIRQPVYQPKHALPVEVHYFQLRLSLSGAQRTAHLDFHLTHDKYMDGADIELHVLAGTQRRPYAKYLQAVLRRNQHCRHDPLVPPPPFSPPPPRPGEGRPCTDAQCAHAQVCSGPAPPGASASKAQLRIAKGSPGGMTGYIPTTLWRLAEITRLIALYMLLLARTTVR